MATARREAVIQAVKARLETITTGNGYEQTVAKVYRPQKSALTVNEWPNLQIIDRGDAVRWHIRDAYENRMTLEIIGHIEKGDDTERVDAISDLLADVEKAVMVDETFSSLARRTWVSALALDLSEPSEPIAQGSITLEIMYRVSRTDPYTTKSI